MINFPTIQGLSIPEGTVKKIESGNVVLWDSANRPQSTVNNVVLEVEKMTYNGEEFVLLDIYPKKGGTVRVTYGNAVKTIVDDGTNDEPSAQTVFFGTYNGIVDEIETPSSGILTISGDYETFGCGKRDSYSYYSCIMAVHSFGTVTKIADYAFYGCSKLTSITIPDTITHLGDYSFQNTGLTEVTIPASIISMGGWVFLGCKNLKYVTLSQGLTSLGLMMFQMSGLTSIIIPSSITSIESSFGMCQSLTSASIHDGVTNIPDDTFAMCRSLTNVGIPYTVTNIGERAFDGCSSLENIIIPPSVTRIGMNAFRDCTKLLNIIISNGVSHIGSGAFNGCTGLTNITIPDSVISIGNDKDYNENAFGGCSNLAYNIYNDIKYVGNSNNPYHALIDASNTENYTIHENTKVIGSSAFSGCTGLTNITIPDSVISIGSGAFNGCTGLTNITIPDSVISIGNVAFSYCTGLTSITFEGSVQDYEKPLGCPMGITIYYPENNDTWTPNVMHTLDDNAVWVAGEKVSHCFGENLIWTLQNDSILIISGSGDIDGNYWSEHADTITSVIIEDGVTEIGNNVFEHCDSLTSVTISDSVTKIGDYAFFSCDSLTSITIPDSVTEIGNFTFNGCGGLTSITIPDSVTEIGSHAFYNCDGLNSITFKGNAPRIGSECFKNDTLTAYYPANNGTWTEEVMQDYDGTITWVAYSE